MKNLFALTVAVLTVPTVQVGAQVNPVNPAAGAPTVSVSPGSAAVNLPPGTALTPINPNPVAPISPGGLRVLPPPAVGSTFSRPVLGAPPNTGIQLNQPVNQGGFPAPAITTIPLAVPNEAFGSFADDFTPLTFPPGPVSVGNTVGQNFVAPAENFARPPLIVDLPPGAVLRPNAVPALPPPTLIPRGPANTFGAPPAGESGTGSQLPPPPAVRPPTAPAPAPATTAPPRNPGARLPQVPAR